MGKICFDDEDKAIQSACSLFIWEGAKAILAMPDKESRRHALKKIPEKIRPYVEKEALRIWKNGKD